MASVNNMIDEKISEILGKYKRNKHRYITNLVISGGGIKGIAELGTLKILSEAGHLKYINKIAATSIGALIGILYCAGYSFSNLYEIFSLINIDAMIKIDPVKLLKNFSLDDGAGIKCILCKLLKDKNIDETITFKQLYDMSKIEINVNSACLNDGEIYYFSHKLSPNMPIVKAALMSCALPIIFPPTEHDGKMFVDGGCIENYPIGIFNDDLDRTLGILLKSTTPYRPNPKNMEDFFFSLVDCLMEGAVFGCFRQYENQTILVTCPSVNVSGIGVSDKVKMDLFNIGIEEGKKYLNSIKQTKN